MNLYTLSMASKGLDLLGYGINKWNSIFADIVELLTTSPDGLYPGVWSAMQTISGYLAGISSILAVIFFYIGLTKSAIHFEELRRPERFFGYFIRLALAEALVMNSQKLLLSVMEIFQGAMFQITKLSGISLNSNTGAIAGVPNEIATAAENADFGEGLLIVIISAMVYFIIITLGFLLYLTVLLRFFKIYIYAAVSPIPLSSFGGESTSRIGRTFLMNYLSVCLQGIVIIISFIIFAQVITTDFTYNDSASSLSNISEYAVTILLGELLLVATVRTSDKLCREMIGG